MKVLNKNDYQEIRTWIHRNARQLELSVWNYFFENGSREAVIDALSYYQNEDGGFGHAVEPDGWNPESSPYATLVVTGILRRTGAADAMGAGHPMMQGIFRYLESDAGRDENGWLFSVPSNDDWPRAPWWSYNEAENQLQSMGITAGLCAFILHYGKTETAVYQTALEYTAGILGKAADAEDFGEMGAGGVCMLLGEVMMSGLNTSFPCEGLMGKMAEVINRSIERNTEKWAGYTPRPSEFIWAPDSPFYKGNEEIVEKELVYLIDTRKPGGVWDITWTWFALGEKYPKEFAVSENWWKASKAIEKLEFLRSFGRVKTEE